MAKAISIKLGATGRNTEVRIDGELIDAIDLTISVIAGHPTAVSLTYIPNPGQDPIMFEGWITTIRPADG